MIRDITRAIAPGFPAWPGDAPYSANPTASFERGDGWLSSRITLGAHTGTHLDAPGHVLEGAGGIETLPLESLVGPAIVVDLPYARPIEPADLPVELRRSLEEGRLGEEARRILLRTCSAETLPALPSRFASLSARTAGLLAGARALLVGIDTPSVDPPGAADLLAHRALARAGIAVLEWVDLRDVPPGPCFLVALPLRLAGIEASPVRAVLLDPPQRA